MNKIIFAAFAAGAILGIFAAWKYSQCHESEEDESFDEEFDISNADDGGVDDDSSDEEKAEAQQIIVDSGYSEADAVSTAREEPYVIPADEFGFFEDFETITLTYYADDILADDADHIIEDKDDTVGGDALSRLRNTDDETVYVRDEKRKVDYEICYDYKTFAEVTGEQPKGYANG